MRLNIARLISNEIYLYTSKYKPFDMANAVIYLAFYGKAACKYPFKRLDIKLY